MYFDFTTDALCAPFQLRHDVYLYFVSLDGESFSALYEVVNKALVDLSSSNFSFASSKTRFFDFTITLISGCHMIAINLVSLWNLKLTCHSPGWVTTVVKCCPGHYFYVRAVWY